MRYEDGERVVVKKHGPGEVVGRLSESCVTVKLDAGGVVNIHVTGVKRESASHLRSGEKR